MAQNLKVREKPFARKRKETRKKRRSGKLRKSLKKNGERTMEKVIKN